MREKKESGIWFTVYADMMTNLALFFLAAFVLTRVDKDIQQKATDSFRSTIVGEDSSKQKADIAQELKDTALSSYSQIEINEKRIKITLPGEVLFASGSYELTEEMKGVLNRIASTLEKTNDPIIVEGFTDNVPVMRGSNWELSLQRAASVVNYFVETAKLPRNKFMAAGYGEYKPVAPNTSDENRSRNRRISLTVLRNE